MKIPEVFNSNQQKYAHQIQTSSRLLLYDGVEVEDVGYLKILSCTASQGRSKLKVQVTGTLFNR